MSSIIQVIKNLLIIYQNIGARQSKNKMKMNYYKGESIWEIDNYIFTIVVFLLLKRL